ncbi:MAG: L,D-transpeptidase [Sulfuriflexus sp.]|nr:L,D-transpeptidase [Sulfuriflexus sp.]
MSNLQVTINITKQSLEVSDDGGVLFHTLVSTALNGAGEENGSECTPRGRHIIRAKIGEGCDLNTVFVARRPSDEVFSESLQQQYPERDWILTRILWLSGCESGINRGGNVDTMRRYIYIHGCPDGTEMGVPASHGCIRMTNKDVVTLFELLPVGTDVLICE